MPIITIKVRVDEGDEHFDPIDPTGLTNAGYERLHGIDGEHPPSLAWLGTVEDVELSGDDD